MKKALTLILGIGALVAFVSCAPQVRVKNNLSGTPVAVFPSSTGGTVYDVRLESVNWACATLASGAHTEYKDVAETSAPVFKTYGTSTSPLWQYSFTRSLTMFFKYTYTINTGADTLALD